MLLMLSALPVATSVGRVGFTMKWLSGVNFWQFLSIFLIVFVEQFVNVEAFLKTARVEEIPFSLSEKDPIKFNNDGRNHGIHAITGLERTRGFFKLFHVPYIVCFFAAKGKWPFIPPMIQLQVDAYAKTLFVQNDTYIRRFCQKFIQIKECFRPLFATSDSVDANSKLSANSCTCATEGPQVFFDRDHIGKVSSETILDTIEFLESFLPAPTKKTKRRKNRVRGRVDEMDVEVVKNASFQIK